MSDRSNRPPPILEIASGTLKARFVINCDKMGYDEAPTSPKGILYTEEKTGALAEATGLIFVRLDEGMSLDKLSGELAQLGFRLVRTMPGSPEAGWVGDAGEDAATGLAHMDRLLRLGGVRHVEPQLIHQAARK